MAIYGGKTLPLPIFGCQLRLFKKDRLTRDNLLCVQHTSFTESNSNSGLQLLLIWHLQQRTIDLWRNERTNESDFRLLREASWEGKYMRGN